MSISNTESNEPENQFNAGIKMILSAYEAQANLFSNEINLLNIELSKKNSKIKEMEDLLHSLLKEKSEYDSKLTALSDSNSQMTRQLEALYEENKELKKVKETIIATIEPKRQKNSMDFEPQPQLLLHKSKNSQANGKNSNKYYEESFINYNGLKNEEDYLSIQQKSKMLKSSRGAIAKSLLRNKKSELDYSKYGTPMSTSTSMQKKKKSSLSAKNSFSERSMSRSNSTRNFEGNNFNAPSELYNGDFFKKCRSVMTMEDYDSIINIIKLFNSKKISKEETYKKLSSELTKGNYNNLTDELDKLFL